MRVKAAQRGSKQSVARTQASSAPAADKPRNTAALPLGLQRSHGNHIVQRWLSQIARPGVMTYREKTAANFGACDGGGRRKDKSGRLLQRVSVGGPVS